MISPATQQIISLSLLPWIPGDQGYFKNLSIHDPSDAHFGENIFYLGGCFEYDWEKFVHQAEFFGHGPGVKRMFEMIKHVDDWTPDKPDDVQIYYDRMFFLQPFKPAKRPPNMITY